MKEPRLYVDFNEMIEFNIVLLSKTDYKTDSLGNSIYLQEGKTVLIYMDDYDEYGNPDNLLAKGIAILNPIPNHIAKWCCLINDRGIYHQSDL